MFPSYLSPAYFIALWIDHCFISDQITQHWNWWFISQYTGRFSTERQHLIDSFIDLLECKINAATVKNFIPQISGVKMSYSFLLINHIKQFYSPYMTWLVANSISVMSCGSSSSIQKYWNLMYSLHSRMPDKGISFHAWHHW